MMSSSRFVLRSHVLIERNHQTEDVTLVDGHTGTICSCNATAAVLLHQLEGEATQEEMATALLTEFDVSEAAARRDVGRFLESLSSMGIVELREEEGDEIARRKLAVA